MNVTELTDEELAERYHPWVVAFIQKHGREPTGIDSLRHHGDYMMAKGSEADIGDLFALARLFNLAVDELIEDAPATMYAGSCSLLIADMLSVLSSLQQQRDISRYCHSAQKRP